MRSASVPMHRAPPAPRPAALTPCAPPTACTRSPRPAAITPCAPHTACTRSSKDDIMSEIRRLQSEMSQLDTRVAASGLVMGANGQGGGAGDAPAQDSAKQT